MHVQQINVFQRAEKQQKQIYRCLVAGDRENDHRNNDFIMCILICAFFTIVKDKKTF